MAAENLTLPEALTKIRALSDKLREAQTDLSKWKLEFSFESDPANLQIKIKALKPFGGGGVIKTLNKSDIIHYADDIDSLIRDVAEQFYEVLLKEHIFNELALPARRVIKNTLDIVKKDL